MKTIQENSFLLVLIAALVFLWLGSSQLTYSIAETRSQVSSSVCNADGICHTTVCSDGQPCQSSSSNELSSTSMRLDENSMAMEPVQETTVMEPVQETTVMEPVQNELDEVVSNVEADPNSLYPASEGDTTSRYLDVGRVQGNGATETEEYAGDTEYDEFEQELRDTPEAVEVETESAGIEIFVDYVIFDDGQRVVKNPNGEYNGGQLELRRGGTIAFNFADCHTECDQPDSIRSVYLIDGDIDDKMILDGSIDDRLKAKFEPSDTGSFQFNVPNGVTGSNTFNKLVIETQQADDNSAFYIQKGVEVS
ncbi:MAG: hypothetical protein WAL46_05745 [Nitrososphaeraceae archaeon]